MSEYVSSAAQSNQVVIHSDGKSRAKWGWLFALIWNGFVFSVIFFQWRKFLEIFEESPVFYVFVLFPIVGIWLLYSSISDVLNWFRFGEAPLTLNNSPVYVGGQVSGYIDINTPFISGMKAEVSLRCAHHYIDNSGEDSRSATDVLWQDDLLMPCQSHGDKIRVLFSFPIEDGLPQSQGKSSDSERHEWNVMLKLPVLGKDLDRSYIVSVDKYYPMSGGGHGGSAQQGVAQSVIPATAGVERQDNSSVDQASATFTNNKLGAQHTHKAIPEISTTHSGKRYYYPASRNRTMGIVLLVFSLFIGGITFTMLNGISDFLPTASIVFSMPFILASTLIFLFGLLVLLHKLEVIVGRAGVKINHKVLFYNYKGVLKPNEIADIKISKSGSSSSGSTSTVWYQLKLIDMDGMETSVGDGLSGNSFAKHIRQEMIDGLGHGWQPSEVVAKPGKVEKLKALKKSPYKLWIEKLIPLLLLLAVAYDLYYRFGPD